MGTELIPIQSNIFCPNFGVHFNIEVGDFTFYNDFVNDPRDFEKNNVLYHYPINHDRLRIGKFCSIACGAKFLFNSANHTLRSLSTYPFPIFYEEWEHGIWADKAWDNKGDIVIGNDVWIGFEAVIFAGIFRNNRARKSIRTPIFHRGSYAHRLAEGEGFEPPDACTSTVFKTAAIDRSANLPY